MNANLAPMWSFLAVEPVVKSARRKLPEAFSTVASPVAGARARQQAFLKILEWVERAMVGRPMPVKLPRRLLAAQVFYAMVDLSDLRALPDRDLERWKTTVLSSVMIEMPTHAVVAGSPITAA